MKVTVRYRRCTYIQAVCKYGRVSFLWVFVGLVAFLGVLTALIMLVPRVFGSKTRTGATTTAHAGATFAASPDPAEPTRTAGWYSDSGHPEFVRWHDGSDWTDRFEPASRHRNAGRGAQQTY